MINKLDAWHKTRSGYFVFAMLELAVTYAFVSLAIDGGNLWSYLLAILFLIGALQNVFKLATSFRSLRNG